MMHFNSLDQFINWSKSGLAKGPTALILIEDDIEIASTIQHSLTCGFSNIVVIGETQLSQALAPNVFFVNHTLSEPAAAIRAVNQIIATKPNAWFHYCFNAEYLFFPFSKSRTIGELINFCEEERRSTILTFVVDLYCRDLKLHPTGVDIATACFDTLGYFGSGRKLANGDYRERQLDFFGGLRSRFEEHVPTNRRKIDRVALFKSAEGLILQDDHTFNQPEYNTYACPWHSSPTAALASFRAAKALRRNPSSSYAIENFTWHGTEDFNWDPQQFLNAGLMEPGQWF